MAASVLSVLARASIRHASSVVLLSLFVASLLCIFPSQGRCLAVSDSGRWTPTSALTGIPVHMALTRGHGPYHSQILWYYGIKHDHTYGGLLGWKPGDYDCTTYPDTTILAPITLPLPDSAGIFCSSHSGLADGRLFLAGGTQPGTEFGVRHAYIFDPVGIGWTKVDTMSQRRWYPTSTTLATGQQLVTSGSEDIFINFHFGLIGAQIVPADSAVFRYGMGANGSPFEAVRSSSTPLWPSPREGQAVVLPSSASYLFGGKDRTGTFLQDSWRLAPAFTTFGADLDYPWVQLAPDGSPPPGRWDHTAVNNPTSHMMVFGGIKKNALGQDVATDDVWRLWDSPSGLQWKQIVIVPSSESPGARCGHAALWRGATTSDSAAYVFGRMLLFGGRGSPTGNPSDSSLWSLNFTSTLDSATWVKLSATGPSPRFHHALAADPISRPDTAYIFGGETSGGQKLNDLWRLNVNSMTWTSVNFLQGTPPSARSRHSATLGGNLGLLFVFGGRSDDSTVHVAHLGGFHEGTIQTWSSFRPHSPPLIGHTATIQRFPQRWAFVPESFDPSGGTGSQWSQLSNAPHFQNWYPQGFVWKADTVFFSGPDALTYKFAMNSQYWKQFPNNSSGFVGGAGVMYRPGRVMKCGSRDVEGGNVVGTTKSLYLGAPDSAQWRPSANPMQPRVNHNLVLLPNGKVMVVGGTGIGFAPKYRPEIWDPDFNSGQGRWSGWDTLAAQAALRDYHSVAMTLPDGRVMSSGGQADPNTRHKAEIYCPPYLFNSDGTLATRPPLSGSPQRVRYGAQFSVCLSSSDSISSVSLIRPAATTHGQDENQRFVPLTFTPANFPTARLTVTAPPDSFDAPPGDYMLFIVNKKGVPSIARWVRMGFSWSEGDVTLPARITDLTRDIETNNSISLYWTASGDDGVTGTASYADLRRSTSPIDSLNFGSATAVNPQPVPVCAGTTQIHVVTGLSPNTTYYFAVKFSDESGNVSLISNVVSGTTLGQCCQGERAVLGRDGATSAGGERGTEGAEDASASVGAAPTSATAAGGTPLVVEATPSSTGLDLRMLAISGESFEGHTTAHGGGVLLQRSDDGAVWTTLGSYELPPGERFALPVPDHATRWVLLEPLALEKVQPDAAGSAGGWTLDLARHSREGDVTDALSGGGATPAMTPGDSLTVHYAATDEGPTTSPARLVVVERPSNASAPTRGGSRRPEGGPGLPTVFALYQNLPNPFAEATTIRFAVPVASRVRIEIYDLLGRRVRTLVSGSYPPGEHQVEWNRRTAGRSIARPGLYFYRMDAGQYREKKRMVILP